MNLLLKHHLKSIYRKWWYALSAILMFAFASILFCMSYDLTDSGFRSVLRERKEKFAESDVLIETGGDASVFSIKELEEELSDGAVITGLLSIPMCNIDTGLFIPSCAIDFEISVSPLGIKIIEMSEIGDFSCIISSSYQKSSGLNIGDKVTLLLGDVSREFIVSAVMENDVAGEYSLIVDVRDILDSLISYNSYLSIFDESDPPFNSVYIKEGNASKDLIVEKIRSMESYESLSISMFMGDKYNSIDLFVYRFLAVVFALMTSILAYMFLSGIIQSIAEERRENELLIEQMGVKTSTSRIFFSMEVLGYSIIGWPLGISIASILYRFAFNPLLGIFGRITLNSTSILFSLISEALLSTVAVITTFNGHIPRKRRKPSVFINVSLFVLTISILILDRFIPTVAARILGGVCSLLFLVLNIRLIPQFLSFVASKLKLPLRKTSSSLMVIAIKRLAQSSRKKKIVLVSSVLITIIIPMSFCFRVINRMRSDVIGLYSYEYVMMGNEASYSLIDECDMVSSSRKSFISYANVYGREKAGISVVLMNSHDLEADEIRIPYPISYSIKSKIGDYITIDVNGNKLTRRLVGYTDGPQYFAEIGESEDIKANCVLLSISDNTASDFTKELMALDGDALFVISPIDDMVEEQLKTQNVMRAMCLIYFLTNIIIVMSVIALFIHQDMKDEKEDVRTFSLIGMNKKQVFILRFYQILFGMIFVVVIGAVFGMCQTIIINEISLSNGFTLF